MSIHNIANKIKGGGPIDKSLIMYLFVILGVGGSSFVLGRLSVVPVQAASDQGIQIIHMDNTQSGYQTHSKKSIASSDTPSLETAGKNYVASKNGKLYYPVSCSGAKRIATKNQVWFKNSSDAETSGYTKASSCK
jgi:hypothetical protein